MTWPIVPILQRYALPIGVVLAIGVAYVYHRVELRDAQRAGYAACRADADDQMRRANDAYRKQEAEEREISRLHDVAHQEAQSALQSQIQSLTAARSVDIGRLRNCATAGRPAPAGAPKPTSEPNGATEPREHGVQAGKDLGRELVYYAGTCEQYRQQVISLQAWIAATHSTHP